MIEALLMASLAMEYSSHAEPEGLGDIVVTGERVSRSKHETASSVVVHDADPADSLPAPDRLEQLLQLVPNIQLGSGGEGPTIRGQDATGAVRDLPAFLGGIRPRATIQVDGRPTTYYELAFGQLPIWDVQRVEVFRSPQTTTQGRNSIGGTIFVETGEPAMDWEGRIQLKGGDHGMRQGSLLLSGPLIDDQLAMRVAGELRKSNTASRITSAAKGIDPNLDEAGLFRVKLRAEPKSVESLRIDLIYSHGRSQAPQIEGIEEPFEERRNPTATYGIFKINSDALTGKLSYRLSGGLDARLTASFGDARIRRFAPPGLGEARIRSRDVSIEPVVDWRPAPGLRVTTGLHYLRANLDQVIDVSAQGFGIGSFSDWQQSVGVFSEGSFALASDLTVTAGLRFQRDRQRRQGAMTGGRTDLPVHYDAIFDSWLPKIAIAWDASPDLRVGAMLQRAYNPGGMTIDTSRFRVDTFGEEQLWDIEAFARWRSRDGRWSLSMNGFRYVMHNAQRTQSIAFRLPSGQIAFAAEVENAPRAWTAGLEIDADWIASPKFSVQSGLGLLDTRITATLAPGDPMLGKQFQRSPHLTATTIFHWRPNDALRLSVIFRANSAYFSDDLETERRRIGGSATVDAKVSWSRNRVTLLGYVRNLFDEFHLTYRFPLSSGLATAGDPREAGLGIEVRL